MAGGLQTPPSGPVQPPFLLGRAARVKALRFAEGALRAQRWSLFLKARCTVKCRFILATNNLGRHLIEIDRRAECVELEVEDVRDLREITLPSVATHERGERHRVVHTKWLTVQRPEKRSGDGRASASPSSSAMTYVTRSFPIVSPRPASRMAHWWVGAAKYTCPLSGS